MSRRAYGLKSRTMFLLLLGITILLAAVAQFESSVNSSFIFGGGVMRGVVFASMVLVLLYYSAIDSLRRFYRKHKKSSDQLED